MEVAEHEILRRQALYRLMAGLLLYPEPERIEMLRRGVSWLEEELGRSDDGLSDVPDLIAWIHRQGDALEDTQSEWVRLFGVSRGVNCYPYEGAYLAPEVAGPLAAALLKDYARAGLNVTANDLPDHVSVELEYMSYLCDLELETLRSQETERNERIRIAQREFLAQHLCRWLPSLVERIAGCEGGMFALVCNSALELCTSHGDALAA
jgi:TorA maturation chaperone TorD